MIGIILNYTLMVVSIVMVVVILLQQKGAGLGAGFGGGGGPVVSTRRGVDLFLHKLTIGLSILFFALTIANFYV